MHDQVEGGAAHLRPDQRRLVDLVYDRFARNGATLEGPAKERYAAIQRELAELHNRFANHLLADEEKYVLYLDADQLGGLPESFVAAAAAAAAERGQPGRYAILNTRSSMDPFLTYSDRRELREQVWRTYYNRGDNGDENDNNRLITDILRLRHERVALLGYDNYAQWRLEDRMAKTPERAMALLEAVWPAALARVAEEVAAMREIAGTDIEPWDYRYYAEKVRQARYDFDSDEVKQYLQLDRLREAMFFVAGELFGFRFTPVPAGTVPVYHPDVRVWEVTDRDSGRHVGFWYLDPYARAGKRSGAWANSYRGHESFDGERTVLVSNNSNFIPGAPGEPVLVSWQDAETLFHEFGHALHALSSQVAYPTLNGGVRDYTEFQSQLLEHWLLTDPVIERYLVHYRTGEPMPAELVAKIKRAKTFNQGFETTEYLACALMDLEYHTTDPTGLDPDAFERQTLARLKMPKEIVMRHRSPQFGHIFSSEGYAAGYYGYLWADVLTADAAEAFAEAPGGYYDHDLAKKLVAAPVRGAQRRRSGRGLPRLPRPRRADRRPDARPRLPGAGRRRRLTTRGRRRRPPLVRRLGDERGLLPVDPGSRQGHQGHLDGAPGEDDRRRPGRVDADLLEQQPGEDVGGEVEVERRPQSGLRSGSEARADGGVEPDRQQAEAEAHRDVLDEHSERRGRMGHRLEEGAAPRRGGRGPPAGCRRRCRSGRRSDRRVGPARSGSGGREGRWSWRLLPSRAASSGRRPGGRRRAGLRLGREPLLQQVESPGPGGGEELEGAVPAPAGAEAAVVEGEGGPSRFERHEVDLHPGGQRHDVHLAGPHRPPPVEGHPPARHQLADLAAGGAVGGAVGRGRIEGDPIVAADRVADGRAGPGEEGANAVGRRPQAVQGVGVGLDDGRQLDGPLVGSGGRPGRRSERQGRDGGQGEESGGSHHRIASWAEVSVVKERR